MMHARLNENGVTGSIVLSQYLRSIILDASSYIVGPLNSKTEENKREARENAEERDVYQGHRGRGTLTTK